MKCSAKPREGSLRLLLINPRNPLVKLGIEQFEGEKPPVISDLPREHFLNKALGRSRSMLRMGLQRVMSATG